MTRRVAHAESLGAVIGVTLLLGVVAGSVWATVTPAMSGHISAQGALVQPQEFGEEFAGVAVFALLMLGYGAVAAVLAWFIARAWRGLPGYVAILGSVIVGTVIAGFVGTWIADWQFGDVHSHTIGAAFKAVPDLWLSGATRGGMSGPWVLVLCAPLGATLVYLVHTLVTRHADLGVGDGAEPVVGEQAG